MPKRLSDVQRAAIRCVAHLEEAVERLAKSRALAGQCACLCRGLIIAIRKGDLPEEATLALWTGQLNDAFTQDEERDYMMWAKRVSRTLVEYDEAKWLRRRALRKKTTRTGAPRATPGGAPRLRRT